MAAQGLEEPFLVLNGDTFLEVNLNELLEFHANHSSEWTFSLFRTNDVGRYMGMDVKADGEIPSLKSIMGDAGGLANGGVYVISPSVLANSRFDLNQKLSLEDDLIPAFMTQGGKVFGIEVLGPFIDIGVPQDYFRAADVLPH